ncbi:MAG TPA: hypothetical protein VJ808_04020 [Gemmatimonadales bacterium]|nr:hypothetical protein [Gemmatimonadales bacterium]
MRLSKNDDVMGGKSGLGTLPRGQEVDDLESGSYAGPVRLICRPAGVLQGRTVCTDPAQSVAAL